MKNYIQKLSVNICIGSCLLSTFLARNAGATNVFWDNNTTSAATSGTWDNTTHNWASSSTLTASTFAYINGNFPEFPGGSTTSAITITVNSAVTCAGMFARTAAPITFSGTGSIGITTGLQGFLCTGAITVNVPITGPGGIEQQQSASLSLFGNNTYSGGTETTGGQLIFYNNNASFGTGLITIDGGGGAMLNSGPSGLLITNAWSFIVASESLNLVGGAPTVGGLPGTTFSGPFALPASGSILLYTSSTVGQEVEISGVISGASGLSIQDSGIMILAGANTYTGPTSVGGAAGTTTLYVSSLNSVSGGGASSSLGAPTTVANGTIALGLTTFPALLIYNGVGETSDRVINLAGTTAGATLENDGSGPITLSSSFTATGAGAKTLTLQGTNSGGANAINGAIVNSGSGATALTKAGTNNWTLSGANTYSGNTTISAGTLALGSTGSINNSPLITIAAGAIFDVSTISSYTFSSTTLKATGGTANPAIINGAASGTVSLGAQQVFLNYAPTAFVGDTTDPSLSLPGTTALTLNNNQIFITNTTATPLGAGTYALIQVGDGVTGTITGTPNPDVFVEGSGIAPGNSAALSVSNSTVVLVVSAATNTTTTTVPTTAFTYSGTTTYTATVAPDPSASGGEVQFYLDGVAFGTPVTVISGGTATSISTSSTLTAGNHTILAQYSGSPDDNYAPSSTSVTQVVNKEPATVTANNQTTTYGTPITLVGSTQFTTNGMVNSETIGSVTLTVTGGDTTNTVPGTATITPSAATGGSFNINNYSVTYVAASSPGLTINPEPVTITAKNQTKIYGQTLATGAGSTQFTTNGMVNKQTVGSVTLACSGAPAASPTSGSPYTITVSAATGGTFTNADYSFTYATGALTVSPGVATVTANPQSMTYGQTVTFGPGSTLFTSSTLSNSETIGTVTLACSGGTPVSPAGNYVITPSAATGGSGTEANYTITYKTNTFTVNKGVATVTANSQSKTYGTALTFGAGSTLFSSSTLSNGETIGSVTLACAGGASNAPIGNYGITASAATGGSGTEADYTITYVTNSLTVSPLTAVLTGTELYNGTTNVAASALSVSNVVNSDDVVVASGSGGLAGSTIGTNAITSVGSLALGGSTGSNYSLVGAVGNVTINPLPVNLSGTRPYDGTNDADSSILTITTNYDGANLTLSGSALLAGSAAGAEPISDFTALSLGGTAATNYTLTGASGSVTVTGAPLTITANAQTNTYGSTLNLGTSAFSVGAGLVSPETVTAVVLSASGGTNGTDPVSGSPYVITPSAATGANGFLAANYSITYLTNSLTLNPLVAVLTGTRPYDGTTAAAFGILSVANVVGSDDVNVASGSGTLASAAVGTNAIASVGTLALGGTTAPNYTLSGASGSVIVTNPHTPFTITSSTFNHVGTNIAIVYQSVPGVVYQVLSSPNAAAALNTWTNEGSAVTATDVFTTNVIPASTSGTKVYIVKDVQ